MWAYEVCFSSCHFCRLVWKSSYHWCRWRAIPDPLGSETQGICIYFMETLSKDLSWMRLSYTPPPFLGIWHEQCITGAGAAWSLPPRCSRRSIQNSWNECRGESFFSHITPQVTTNTLSCRAVYVVLLSVPSSEVKTPDISVIGLRTSRILELLLTCVATESILH